MEFLCADVFALLPELEAKGQKFDLVILDPPAFTKSRASVKKAVTGYREINLRAMKLIRDGGFLATCSCSHFVDYELFTQTIGQAARNVHKRLQYSFGEAYGLSIESEPDIGTTVTIRLPGPDSQK